MDDPPPSNAPLVSDEGTLREDPPKNSTSRTEVKYSEKSLSGTTRKKQNKRKSEEIIAEIRRQEQKQEVTEEVKKEEVKVEVKEPVNEEPAVDPAPKRTKVVADDEEEEESWWRGGIVKPLLLAGLGAASFAVNHLYNTKQKKQCRPIPQQQTKQNATARPTLRAENRTLKIPGFS